MKSSKELTTALNERISNNLGAWIVTVNVDIHRQLSKDLTDRLGSVIENEALTTADGFPIRLLAQYLRGIPYERVAGSEYVLDLAKVSVDRNLPLIVAGGKTGDANRVAVHLRSLFANIEVRPIELPFGDSKSLTRELRQQIDPRTFIMLLGVGALKQEEVILELRKHYPKSIYMGCGAGISYLAGSLARAPKIFSKLNLEWLWRIAVEPKRLFKRYILQDLPYLIRLVASVLR